MFTNLALATALVVTPVQFRGSDDQSGILRRIDEQARFNQMREQQSRMLQEQARHNQEMENLQRQQYYDQMRQRMHDLNR